MTKAPHKKSAAPTTSRKQAANTQVVRHAVTLAIGKELRRFREQKGMTQLDLAHTAEIERTRVSKLELGYCNPAVLTLASLCHVLGITLSDLFAEIKMTHAPVNEGGVPRRSNQAVLDKPSAKTSGKASDKTTIKPSEKTNAKPIQRSPKK